MPVFRKRAQHSLGDRHGRRNRSEKPVATDGCHGPTLRVLHACHRWPIDPGEGTPHRLELAEAFEEQERERRRQRLASLNTKSSWCGSADFSVLPHLGDTYTYLQIHIHTRVENICTHTFSCMQTGSYSCTRVTIARLPAGVHALFCLPSCSSVSSRLGLEEVRDTRGRRSPACMHARMSLLYKHICIYTYVYVQIYT